MAKQQYLQANALILKIRRHRQLKQALFGVASVLGLAFHWLPAYMGFLFSLRLFPSLDRHQAGARGEARALGLPHPEPGSLIKLPDTYTLFNNLIIPTDYGLCEMDLIAVGPNGVFIIESKYYTGVLSGNAHDRQWTQQKTYRGHTTSQSIANPVMQVERQVRALKHLLAKTGYTGWVQGIVVFTHPDVNCRVTRTRTSLLTLPILSQWIRCFEPPYPQQEPGWPVPVLKSIQHAMTHPPFNIFGLRRYWAQTTGRYLWMRTFRPQPIIRYWNKEQVTDIVQQLDKTQVDTTSSTGLTHIRQHLKPVVDRLLQRQS